MKKLGLGIMLIMMVAFQNCSKMVFSDIAKENTLSKKTVFETSNIDTQTPTSTVDTRRTPAPATLATGTVNVVSASLPIRFACPNHLEPNQILSVKSKEELKVVLVQDRKVICEIHNVRDQIFGADRKVDISSCGELTDKERITIYVVREGVTSGYAEADFKAGFMTMPNFFGHRAFERSLALAEYYDPKYHDTDSMMLCPENGDPLVIQLGSQEPQSIKLSAASFGINFDLLGKNNSYHKVQTAWLTDAKSLNYFLVLPNARGQVLGIDQMFGDSTIGPDAKFATHGFAALAKYDSNHDHKIDRLDPIFSKLKLWKDENLDGIAQENEMQTLTELKVKSIDLKYDDRYEEVDQHGNIVKYKSIVTMENGEFGLVFDLWLTYLK